MVGTIEINGTGGIIEGNLGSANVNVNLDPVYGHWDGDNDAVYFNTSDNDLDSIWAGNGGCCSAWIYPKSDGEGNYGRIFDKAKWTLNFIAESGTNGMLEFYHQFDSTSGSWRTANYVVPYNAWTHVAVTYDSDATGNDAVIYINGVSQGSVGSGLTESSTPVGTINSDASDSLYVGNRAAGDRTFDGYIMDAKIYKNVVVTATNIAKMASKINVDKDAPDMPTSGLQAWWKFNASTTADSSGNSNNLTVGTALSSPVYDAFSVNVQDNSTTTDGNFTITQGKVECLSLSSPDFERTISNKIVLASAATKTTHQTVACWVRAESVANYRHFLGEADNKGIGFYDDGAIAVTGLGTRMKTTFNPTAGQWFHFAMTYDGSNTKVYINGEFDVSQAEDNRITLNYIGTDDDDGDTDDESWDGRIRDVRTYDFALSSDQISSLYSKSYNVTPYKWWKLDEGHITGAAANAAGSYADSGTATAILASGQQFTDSLVSNDNEALDLDGTLTIAANGTLSAPRGTLTCAGNLTVTSGGTYTHNNGLFTADHGSSNNVITVGGSNATFYNFTNNSSGGQNQLASDLTVENTLTQSGGGQDFKMMCSGGVRTLTMGTSTSAGTITGGASSSNIRFDSNTTNAGRIHGASSLYPCVIGTGDIDWDSGGSGSKVEIQNIDDQVAVVTGGGGVTVKLTGDMEFDAVTVSSGDTLDINGQRMECSGILQNSGAIKSTGGGLLVAHDAIRHTGSMEYLHDGDVNVIVNGGSGHDWRLGAADGAGPWCRTLMTNGTVQTTDDVGRTDGTQNYNPESMIVGSGTFTNTTNVNYLKDMTIATGSTFTPSHGSVTVGISGDFTTSGGLLGPSCLTLNGTDEYAYNSGTTFLIEDEFTIEFWSKLDSGHTGNAYVIDFYNSGGVDDNHNRIIVNQDTDDIKFAVHDSTGSGTELETSGLGLNDGKWHHIACTHSLSSSLMQVYVDGKLRQTQVSTANRVAESMRLKVGSAKGGGTTFFPGSIDELRIFQDVRSADEIRSNMFVNVHGDISGDNLIARYGFNEGTGSDVDNSQGTGARDLSLNDGSGAATDLWAGAGTFTYGTSTLVMTGTSKNINFAGNEALYNLTISGTTSLTEVSGGYNFSVNNNLTVDASKTLSSTASEILKITNGASATVTLNNTSGLANLFTLRPSHSSGTLSLPELTTKKLLLDTSGGTTQATGDHTYTTELEVNSGTTFNANGNTINVKLLDSNTGTVNLSNSALSFLSAGQLNLNYNSTLTTGNTTITGYSSGSKTTAVLPMDGNFEVVGDVKWMKMNTDSDLTVIGAVIDCDASLSGANIRQWHHTLDTQQLLDADSAGDDDLRLSKPALDNAHELQTG